MEEDFATTQSDQNLSHNHSLSTASLTGGIRKISEGFRANGSASGVFTKTNDGNSSITGSSSTSPVGGVDLMAHILTQWEIMVEQRFVLKILL